ncbi:MAG: flavodoxin family protein [Lentimicrobium sp.]|nr:flavodoxin family protein [Lentimicrobium sp.]
MKALIIYDSAFGNTEQIALAMQNALAENNEVSAIRPGDFKPEMLNGLDLLIAGSPTQKFNPLKGISDLLNALPQKSLAGIKVAAFDTRIDIKKVNNKALNFFVYFFGYAAKPLAGKLVAKGGSPAASPEGFFVEGTNGPVSPGERERASIWAKSLVS